VGASLGIDPELLGRHPFQGLDCPLGFWVISPEKVSILQDVDAVFIDGLKSWGCTIKYGKLEQFFFL
jgi:GMP synthase (glutamine-hydrolysing)